MIEPVLYSPLNSSWGEIKGEILSIEREAFGSKAFSEEELANDFNNENNVIVLLKNGQDVIGFTYAAPANVFKTDQFNLPDRNKTAWIIDTVIKANFRGRGLVGGMMDLLEQELKRRGFEYVARTAAVANNYAQNVTENYKTRIIEQKGPIDSKWGPQMFFLIKL